MPLRRLRHVRSWHLADNPVAPAFVRYWTKADKTRFWPKMACPLMTHLGHLPAAQWPVPELTPGAFQRASLSRYDALSAYDKS
jgi:hypothetical protein